MLVRLVVVLIAAVLSGCASPVQTLSGRIVDAAVIVEDDKLRMIDWVGAGSIAAEDGIGYVRAAPSSPKPTREEIEAANKRLERNRAYTEYVQRPEVLKRAEARAIPQLERWLVEVPSEGFSTNRYTYPPFGQSGRDLRLILYPEAALISPKTFAEQTSAQAATDIVARGLVAILAGGAAAGRETLRFTGDYELRTVQSGLLVSSGRLNVRFQVGGASDWKGVYPRFFSMMIWDAILRGQATGRAKTRAAPGIEVSTSDQAAGPISSAAQSVPVSAATAESFAPVPGSPPLFEGTSYALFTPEHIQAYCKQDWQTRPSPDGRTEYNPCTQRSAFAP